MHNTGNEILSGFIFTISKLRGIHGGLCIMLLVISFLEQIRLIGPYGWFHAMLCHGHPLLLENPFGRIFLQ